MSPIERSLILLRTILIIFGALGLLAACSTTSGTATSTLSAGVVASEDQVDRTAYRLGASDELRIIVFGEDSLSGEFVIDGEGTISMPLIGEVDAAGLTLQELRGRIEAQLSEGYLTDPRVSAEVQNYRPFYILGEVDTSGEFPYTDGLTVMNAVARAGGFTYRANTRRVFIQRAGSDVEIEVELTPTLRVMPGDTIRITERFF